MGIMVEKWPLAKGGEQVGSGDCQGREFGAEGPTKANPLKQIYNCCKKKKKKKKLERQKNTAVGKIILLC